jgi:ketopantoate reductase
MRIAVIGAGGIGAIYAASLAKAGAEVAVVARGAHLAAIRKQGLKVEGDRGETHVRLALASDDPSPRRSCTMLTRTQPRSVEFHERRPLVALLDGFRAGRL